ncbi:hypothetical protein BDV34DRAFT_223040 [Aspergillus parasiticus]|uniref:EcxA zinc-binding domain-containing protein n=1 Tax=Aspergillus parasiticus TaxID=5067 RepID=A0A5N6DRT3_ASPPA|nr:hypothetical protein BDV34DRAFT_223040 [Aspergillus parasiticus]
MASSQARHSTFRRTLFVSQLEKAKEKKRPLSTVPVNETGKANDTPYEPKKDQHGEKVYSCATEKKRAVNTGLSSLRVGAGQYSDRWAFGSTINFAAFAEGYPETGYALLAARELDRAAQKWNDVELGVQFKWVPNLEDAAFVLAYGGDNGDTLAQAFFPNGKDFNTLNVYQRAFEGENIKNLMNIFLHELGHVLGLRHEFAAEREAGVRSSQIGTANPKSVMSYTFPPEIQESDKEYARQFYSLLPIRDFEPDN